MNRVRRGRQVLLGLAVAAVETATSVHVNPGEIIAPIASRIGTLIEWTRTGDFRMR